MATAYTVLSVLALADRRHCRCVGGIEIVCQRHNLPREPQPGDVLLHDLQDPGALRLLTGREYLAQALAYA